MERIVDGEIRSTRRYKEPEDWTALIKGAHKGYITWETYLSNRERMLENAACRAGKGAPREGRALLTGLLLCGRCGQRMTVRYQKSREQWVYVCNGDTFHGGKVCWMVSGVSIDDAVQELFLRTIVPKELDLSLAVDGEVESQSASLNVPASVTKSLAPAGGGETGAGHLARFRPARAGRPI